MRGEEAGGKGQRGGGADGEGGRVDPFGHQHRHADEGMLQLGCYASDSHGWRQIFAAAPPRRRTPSAGETDQVKEVG